MARKRAAAGILAVGLVVAGAVISHPGCTPPTPRGGERDLEAQCKAIMTGIAADIVKLKGQFAELAAFQPPPAQRQLRLDYFFKTEWVRGKDKRSSYWKPKEGGCIITVEVFPKGHGWPGDRAGPNVRSRHVRCKVTGILVCSSIECRNATLLKKLDAIIAARTAELRVGK